MALRFISFVVVVFSAGVLPLFAQSESLIEREIDSALERGLWTLGPFRLTPSLRVGAGYDSNGLYSAEFPQEDIRVLVAPGLNAVAPIRKRALFEVFQEVNILYYDKLEVLRDVFGVTRVGGAFGGHRVMVGLQDQFSKQRRRPTSEFDIPVDEQRNDFDASVTTALGWRHELTLSYRNGLYRILDTDSEAQVEGSTIQSRLNRTEHDYRVALSRRLTSKTSAVYEGFFEIYDFEDDAALRDAKSYGVVGGFQFAPRTNVTGQALLGYKRIVPDFVAQADYRGLIGSVDVGLALGRRYNLRVLFSRDAVPSIFQNNWYFIENRVGGSVQIRLMEKFSVTPGAVVGRNTYPRPELLPDDQGGRALIQVVDRFETYSLSLNFHVTQIWTVSVRGDYWRRNSNFRLFTKDRFTFGVGVTTSL